MLAEKMVWFAKQKSHVFAALSIIFNKPLQFFRRSAIGAMRAGTKRMHTFSISQGSGGIGAFDNSRFAALTFFIIARTASGILLPGAAISFI